MQYYNSTLKKYLSSGEAKLLKSIFKSDKEAEILEKYKALCKRLLKKYGKNAIYIIPYLEEIITKNYVNKLLRHRRGGL